MKHFFLIISLLTISLNDIHAQLGADGGNGIPFEYKENLAGTDISLIYIFNSLNQAVITYKTSASVVRFYQYSTSSQNKIEIPTTDISTTNNGNTTTYTIHNLTDSRGYFAETDGVETKAIWIIDYQKHLPQLKAITTATGDNQCEMLKLLIQKQDELSFFAKNGGKHLVRRLYNIEYNTQEWVEGENPQFMLKTKTIENQDIGTELTVDAPLEDTFFKLSGDQFAKYFGLSYEIESPVYQSQKVEAHIIAKQESNDEESGFTSELGGSAPANITFYGKGNEPTVNYYTWFIFNKKDMENPIARYTDKNIEYVFDQSGEYEVQLEVANKNSTCVDSTSVSFSTSDFSWDVPNIMIIGGEKKMEFRVSYKSIISFKCTIFNRWGNKIYEWNDPTKGWDGKYKGSYVSPGVYFYVMTARGGDGKSHTKSGDINVLYQK